MRLRPLPSSLRFGARSLTAAPTCSPLPPIPAGSCPPAPAGVSSLQIAWRSCCSFVPFAQKQGPALLAGEGEGAKSRTIQKAPVMGLGRGLGERGRGSMAGPSAVTYRPAVPAEVMVSETASSCPLGMRRAAQLTHLRGTRTWRSGGGDCGVWLPGSLV